MTLRTTLAVAVLLAVGATRLAAAAPDNQIVLAAMQRDAAGVRALIAKGADVNVADGDGTHGRSIGPPTTATPISSRRCSPPAPGSRRRRGSAP